MKDADRVGCINPRCNRTYKREAIEHEVVCGKCFKLCPVERRRYRALKRRINHARRYPQKWTYEKVEQLYRLFDKNWDRMKARFYEPERPLGIDAFLGEMGMA